MKSILKHAMGMAAILSALGGEVHPPPRQVSRKRTSKTPLTKKQVKARKKSKAAKKARKRGK